MCKHCKLKQNWFKSFQFRIFRAFLIITTLFVVWGGAYQFFDTKRTELNSLMTKSQFTLSQHLSNNQNFQLFQIFGYRDSSLYKSGHQEYLNAYREGNRATLDAIAEIQVKAREYDLDPKYFRGIEAQIQSLDDSVESLSHLYVERGFKDYGLEGKIRDAAHILESEQLLPPVDLLTLRRHEKDFILRSQWSYVTKFNKHFQEVKSNLQLDSPSDSLLFSYQSHFNDFAQVQRRISLSDGIGLVHTLAEMDRSLEREFQTGQAQIEGQLKGLTKGFDDIIRGLGIVMFMIIMALSIRLTRSIGRDFKQLSLGVSKYTESGFSDFGSLKHLDSPIEEVNILLRDLGKMDEELKTSFQKLEKAAKEAQRVAKVKSYFLANMSHEIRTPLNGVLGMIHLLRETQDPDKRKEYQETISYSAEYLGDLVNMILDFSKIDAGEMQLHLQPMDLSSRFDKLLHMMQLQAKDNGNSLVIDSDLGLSHEIITDEIRLQQVLINLIGNALKFTKDGEVKLILREQKPSPSNTTRIFFAVEDNGIGIPEDKIASLFDAYSQTDRSVQKEYGGTGLGLAITHELIKLMGGELQVKSTLGQGSLFYFELEFEKGPLIQKRIEQEEVPVNLSQKVLVVEDNPVNQKVITLMLERYGLATDLANNGREAIKAFENQVYGLILMDLQMPLMDGLEATRRITQSPRYQTYPCPIIAVSANAFDDDRKEALSIGCKDFIPKPIQPRALQEILKRYLILNSLS